MASILSGRQEERTLAKCKRRGMEDSGEGEKLEKMLKIVGEINEGKQQNYLSSVEGPFEAGPTLIHKSTLF